MTHLRIVSWGTDDPAPRKSRLRVVLADDHLELRRSLRRLLQAEPDIELVGEAEDFPGATRQVRRQRPDVLVLDLGMPGGSSRERIQRLRERWPGTEIVAITMEKSRALAEQALNAGAIGVVLKDTADVELAAALRDAARGVRYESPRLRQPSGQANSKRR